MSLSDQAEIEQLERTLRNKKESLSYKQNNCAHDWSEPKSDPESYQYPVFDHYEPHGSDPEPIYNYITKYKNRWSRYCKKCAKTEYTYEQKAVKYVPDFK